MPIRYLLTVILAALALSSCARSSGDAGRIPEDRFVALYADLLIAREEAPLRGFPTGDTTLQDSVCSAYGVTDAQVQSEISAFQTDLERWKEFHTKVTKRLEELHRAMTASNRAAPTP